MSLIRPDAIRRSYLTALSLVAVLSCASQFFVQHSLGSGSTDAGLINRAGRQRMLSQRIVKASLVALSDLGSVHRHAELVQAMDGFRVTHEYLFDHDSTPDHIRAGLAELTPLVDHLCEFGAQALAGEVTGADATNEALAAEAEFLPSMHRIVGEYERVAVENVELLSLIEYGLLIGTLIILLLEALFVFEPMRRVIRSQLAQLAQSRERALKLASDKEQFLGLVGSDIKEPLADVLEMNGLLMGTELDAVQREYVQKGELAGKRLSALLRDVLEFVSVGSGKVDVERAAVNLEQLAEETMGPLRSLVDGRSVEIRKEMSLDGMESVIGDSTKLQQIGHNLLANAITHTDKGEIVFQLEVERTEDSAELILRVSDTGSGIREEDLRRIFDRYVETESGEARKLTGAGIGLAIARGVTEGVGGSLQVQSEFGEGSTLEVRVPVSSPTEDDVSAPASLIRAVRPSSLHQMRVIVLDQDPRSREQLTKHLVDGGSELEVVTDAESLLSRAAESTFHVAVVNIDHLGEGALPTIGRLRRVSSFQGGSVIAASSSMTEDLERRCTQEGVSCVLNVPYGGEEVASVLRGQLADSAIAA